MPIFKGIPPGRTDAFDNPMKTKSVMCIECQQKFKNFMKYGGERPKPCEICKERLKDKMYSSRYPDR